MGSKYPQETIIRTFQSLDAFRDTNMTQLEIHANNIETSFKLDGNMLNMFKEFVLNVSLCRMHIDGQALRTFANYSKCLENLEISDNSIYDPKIEVFFAVCYFRNLRSFVYSDNNQRIGHIKYKTPYVLYDVNNTNMNTLQRFEFFVTVCISKTLTTLFLKDSRQFLTLNDFSFVGGKYLQNLTFLHRLNGCSFQIAVVENLKYLDMTGWYCNKVSGHLLSKLPLLETLIASDIHLDDGLKNHSEAAY